MLPYYLAIVTVLEFRYLRRISGYGRNMTGAAASHVSFCIRKPALDLIGCRLCAEIPKYMRGWGPSVISIAMPVLL